MYNKITTGKEMIVRKKVAGFIEKCFRYFNYDFRHDIFKQIIYGEIEFSTPLEEKMKTFYDGYMYLLNNHKTPLSKKILNKFFYILFGKEVNQLLVLKLVRLNFECFTLETIDYVVDFHINAYREMKCLGEEESFIISLMFLNYSLLRIGIPTIYFTHSKLLEYVKFQKSYLLGDKENLKSFIIDFLGDFKFQDKKYYKELRPLTTEIICSRIKSDEEMLLAKHNIKNIYLFGSFAKDIARIDSDIDLLIVFSESVTSESINKTVNFISEYYYRIFQRFIDVIYTYSYLNDDLINELVMIKKII